MATIEYQKIEKIMKNSRGLLGTSYDSLINSKLLGILDMYFIKSDLDKNLKTILEDFIKILDGEEYKKFPNYKKFCLYTNNDFINCYLNYSFPISMYINNNEEFTEENTLSCYQFPLFFKELCVRYNIEPYASMDLKEIDYLLNDNLNISHEINPRRKGHKYPVYEIKVLNANYNEGYVTEYKEYYDSIKRNEMQPRMRECVHTEEISLSLQDKGSNIWVSRCGSGYGYDILNIDTETGTENLIEVKTTSKEDGSFLVSKYERRMMYQIADSTNANYYVYLYKYNIEEECLESEIPEIYRYDKENHVLVNMKDNTIVELQARAFSKSNCCKKFLLHYVATQKDNSSEI